MQNRAGDVACEDRHQNHDGRHVVVLFDLHRLTFSRRRMTTEARILGSDVTAGVYVRSQCRHSRGALSVHLRALHCAGHVRAGERSKFGTEPATSHARAVMDRGRPAYLHDKGTGSHLRRYLCRTYDGTHAVPLSDLGLETLRESLGGGYHGEAVMTPGWHSTYLHHDYGIGPYLWRESLMNSLSLRS